jgi:hypothetical protein
VCLQASQVVLGTGVAFGVVSQKLRRLWRWPLLQAWYPCCYQPTHKVPTLFSHSPFGVHAQGPGDAPTKVFDRTPNLVGAQIISYRTSPDGKWCVLIGIMPGAPER